MTKLVCESIAPQHPCAGLVEEFLPIVHVPRDTELDVLGVFERGDRGGSSDGVDAVSQLAVAQRTDGVGGGDAVADPQS
jgi:hypothetical protein